MIKVEEAKQASDDLYVAFRSLVPQLTTTAEVPTQADLQAIIEAEATKLLLAIDTVQGAGGIVGVLTLIVYRIPTGKVARIEDVVVEQDMRRRGIAQLLVQHALELARKAGVKSVDLTSNPARVAAIRLYSKMGFVKRNTNLLRFSFHKTNSDT